MQPWTADVAAALPLLIVVTGPTGSGKSALAEEVATHLRGDRPVEIVSVDSAQVYRGMDIGTAKPSLDLRARLPHHLIDTRDPAQSYSAGEFVRDARAVIAQILHRGHLPMLVGGTMLYLRALYDGLADLPPASPEVRQELDARAATIGWPAMHEELSRIDSQAASHIARGDAQRIQRALEVYRLTGVPISQWQRPTHGARDDFRWLRYALLPASRSDLRRHLGLRFEAMLQAGLINEVRNLAQRHDLTERHPSMRAVGYRQLWRYCRGECSLAQACEQAVTATAQLAKRQLTWLRAEQNLTALSANSPDEASVVVGAIREQFASAPTNHLL
jgi:tRNA dimethylallyltransferase